MHKFMNDYIDIISRIVLTVGGLFVLWLFYWAYTEMYRAPYNRLLAEGKLAEAARFANDSLSLVIFVGVIGAIVWFGSWLLFRHKQKQREAYRKAHPY